MPLTKITDHVTRAQSRLLEQNKASASHKGLLAAFVDQIQALEDCFYSFLVLRNVETATGAQLDLIGKLVGQPREGRNDTDYRLWVKAKIKINKSSGEIQTLVDVAKLLIPGATITITEYQPAAMIMSVGGVLLSTTFARQVATLLRSGKAGGVRFLLYYQVTTAAETFTLDTSATGKGFGGAEAIDANTLGAWRLNEANAADSAEDSTTNNRDLAISTLGGPAVGTGKWSSCRQFRNGSGQAFIAPADVTVRDAARDGAISWSGWVKPIAGAAAAGIVFMINGADFSFDAPEAVLFEVTIGTDGRVRWEQWQNTNPANVTFGAWLALTVGEWNHVLITRTARDGGGNHEYKSYLNGVLIETKTTPGLDAATIAAVGVGASVHYIGLGCYRNNSGPTDAESVGNFDGDEFRLSSVVRTLADAQAGAQLTAGQLAGIC